MEQSKGSSGLQEGAFRTLGSAVTGEEQPVKSKGSTLCKSSTKDPGFDQQEAGDPVVVGEFSAWCHARGADRASKGGSSQPVAA